MVMEIKRWQAESFTRKILPQLKQEPEVTVESTPYSNHNVPNLNDIGNYVECSSAEDFYLRDAGQNIEEELKRMFKNDVEEVKIKPTRTISRKPRNLKKKQNLNALLIRLFGSTLEDIDLPAPKKVDQRRNSLPVSININSETFKPLKLENKRKSVTEINSSRKVQKIVRDSLFATTNLFDVSFTKVCELVIPPTYEQVARVRYSEYEMDSAYVIDKPMLSSSVTVQSVPVIDLTKDDSEPKKTHDLNRIRIEVLKEESGLSEEANVPVSRSLPLLSPHSAAEPPGREAVLPHRSSQSFTSQQRPPPPTRPKDLEILPIQPRPILPKPVPPSVQILPVPNTQQMLQVPQKRRRCSNEKTQSQAQPQPQPQPQPPPQPPRLLPSQPQWMYPPQLLRILHQTPLEFQLLSNAAFAEKIHPHVYKLLQWRIQASGFFESSKILFNLQKLKENGDHFRIYSRNILQIFSNDFINDLAHVDVQNFNLYEIFALVSARIVELRHTANLYCVCNLIHLLLRASEARCTTPFLKKFYHMIKLSIERMEKKTREVPAFTLPQIKLLETQIRQYQHIQNWLTANLQQTERSNKKKTPPRTTPQQQPPHGPNSISVTAFSHDSQRSSISVLNSYNPLKRVTVEAPRPTPPPLVPTPPAPTPPAPPPPVPASPQECNKTSENEVTSTIKNETKVDRTEDGDVIDLTWIDDGDEVQILEEIIECKSFPFKMESFVENEIEGGAPGREVVSPSDSGLGSPVTPISDDGYKCLCGNRAIYVCACNSSMYCSSDCQVRDWAYHQRLCHKMKT